MFAATPTPTQTYFPIISFAILLFDSVTVETCQTHSHTHTRVLTLYAQQEVKIMKASTPLSGRNSKKQSNCQLLVSWWLLSMFTFQGRVTRFKHFRDMTELRVSSSENNILTPFLCYTTGVLIRLLRHKKDVTLSARAWMVSEYKRENQHTPTTQNWVDLKESKDILMILNQR